MDNHGGRVNYDIGQEVIITNHDHTLSKETYKVAEKRSDRHGYIGLTHPVGGSVVRVHNRRVLPTHAAGKIIVIEAQDKFYAVCGKCGRRESYSDEVQAYTCPGCGNQDEYFWLGDRPVAPIAKPVEKKPKKVTAKMDIRSLVELPNCELWSRKMAFDHHEIDARTNVLICLDGQPRKLVFNTYDGKLGKKATGLPLDDFLSGIGTGWYKVNPSTYTRELTNGGYTREDR